MNDLWSERKRQSDVYLDEIKQILGLYLIGEPPVEEDQKRNTDLIVLNMEAVRIMCRVRTSGYQEKYANEFTIRAFMQSGCKTELRKIIDGWGDYMLYGFGDGEKLILWSLLDLKVFRNRFVDMVYSRSVPDVIMNHDKRTGFIAFDVNNFPFDLVIASNRPKTPTLEF